MSSLGSLRRSNLYHSSRADVTRWLLMQEETQSW